MFFHTPICNLYPLMFSNHSQISTIIQNFFKTIHRSFPRCGYIKRRKSIGYSKCFNAAASRAVWQNVLKKL